MAVKKSQLATVLLVREAKNLPCTDCGVAYPYYVMQFDHLRDKEHDLSSGRVRSLGRAKIQKEIEKCEVVCANCHAERTHHRRSQQSAAA